MIVRLVVVGLLTMLLAACGSGGDEPSGTTGGDDATVDRLRTEVTELLTDLAPQVAEASGATVGPAEGAFRETGFQGDTTYLEFVAESTLEGAPDEAAVTEVLEQAGLEVSTSDDPNGSRVVQGRGDGISATVRARPDADSFVVQVKSAPAEVTGLSTDRRIELRKSTPIDLG